MDQKIKLLSIGHSYVVSMNRAILREIAKDPQFEVTIGAPAHFHGSLRSLKIEPEPIDSNIKLVSLRTILSQKMHIFSYHPSDLNKLIKQNFDCAHIWEEPYILAGFQVMRSLHNQKTPFLFRTAQSLIKNYIFPFNKFEAYCFKRASRFIAGGHLVYKAMRDKGLEIPGQVLSLAVDTKAFKPYSHDEKIKKQKELGLEGPVICYLGRLSEEKGCDLFMEALTQLKSKKWSFLVMGSGPYEQKIKLWAKQNDLNDRVKIALFKHDEVPKVLPACDLLIAPSQTRSFWKEQFGRMLVEAFASGVPVIGSDSGEIPRVIDQAGRVLKEDDVNLWRENIEEFLDHPENFQKYIPLGHERAHIYSSENIGNQYKDVYKELAKG